MPISALYDVLYSFNDIHKVVLNLADDLKDELFSWKLEGCRTSIGFYLWYQAREPEVLP